MSKSKQIKRVVFFSSKIDSGGAEKHLVRLVNALAARVDLEIILIVTVAGGNYEALLDKRIRFIAILKRSSSYTTSMIKSYMLLRKQLNAINPDLIFSIQDGPNVLMLLNQRASNTPIIIGVQNNPILNLRRNYITQFVKWLAVRYYPTAQKMISLSSGVAADYLQIIPAMKDKISIIPNIGWPEYVKQKENSNIDGVVRLLACGRLEEQKDYPTMLKALQILSRQKIQFTLTILGRGSKENDLRVLAEELGLTNKIHFKGFTSEVSEYYYNSDLFLLSSKWEGFGNVIVEAMAHGLPVISADCPHGPAEIIDHRKNGLLFPVGDFVQLSESINELLSNKILREQISKTGIETAARFMPVKIAEKYYEVLKKYL